MKNNPYTDVEEETTATGYDGSIHSGSLICLDCLVEDGELSFFRIKVTIEVM